MLLENFIRTIPFESEANRESANAGFLVYEASSLIVMPPVGAVLSEKDAVTDFGPLMVKVQLGLDPEQSPDHPAKTEPSEAAVRVTDIPLPNDDEQFAPQSMPRGELVTVPLPDLVIFTEKVSGNGVTCAVIPVEILPALSAAQRRK